MQLFTKGVTEVEWDLIIPQIARFRREIPKQDQLKNWNNLDLQHNISNIYPIDDLESKLMHAWKNISAYHRLQEDRGQWLDPAVIQQVSELF